MIEYIRGILAEKESSQVTVEAHGVGYEIIIPLSTFEKLPPPGAEIKLHTHHHVREDAQKLFGFLTKQERELFRQLISVSSIGPKTAMSVLSHITVCDLINYVTLGDSTRLTKVPGIGAKTAQRLLMELRGKLDGVTALPSPAAAGDREPGRPGAVLDVSQEAYSALVSLGYNDKQVARAVERVRQIITDKDAPVEEWIKKALQVI